MNFDYIFKKHKITEKYIDQIRIYVELSHSSLMSAWRQQDLIVEGCCCCCRQVASVVSDSVRPQRRQPTRLPRPWDSPGKNTGVGCHFLLHCVKVKGEREVAHSCPTLSDPMDCSPPGSSIHGSFQARVLEWGAIAFSGQLRERSLKPNRIGFETHSCHCHYWLCEVEKLS